MKNNYNEKDPISILNYAKGFKEKTFRKIINEYDIEIDVDELYKNAKGKLGTIIEKYGFGYNPNSKQEADFKEAGVELKQTPIDFTKKGLYRAGERLSVTMINFNQEVETDFYKSHVWEKIRLMLLIQYIRDKSINDIDYVIKHVNLFTPPEKDLKIIIADYNKINEKIKAGKAHELSEGDTLYLGACTKGGTAATSWGPQYYSNELAKSRNYCLKQSYMNYVLNEYILKDKVPHKLLNENIYRDSSKLEIESIINDAKELENTSFEQLIINKLSKYIGKTDEEICNEVGIEFNTSTKNFYSLLTLKALGIKSNQAEEFVKAGIVVKTIRVESNNQIDEHMSFPTFEFDEIANVKWEDSNIFDYFSQTKFLFTVYKNINGRYELDKIMFWNMPYSVFDNELKECWLEVQKVINEGVQFRVTPRRVFNNLPSASFNHVVHVRPHASESAYKLNNGFEKGDISKYASKLPNGEFMTRQCFWLDKDYIIKVLGYKK